MSNPSRYALTKAEKRALYTYLSMTFVVVFLFSSILAFYDVRDELYEEAEELIERIEAVYADGQGAAIELSALSGQDCSLAHQQQMEKILGKQVFIQSIQYQSRSGVTCAVGSHAPFDTRLTIESPGYQDLVLLSNQSLPGEVVGIQSQLGEYLFTFPARVSSAFLLFKSDYEIYIAVGQSNPYHLTGSRGLFELYHQGMGFWWPDYMLLTRSCGMNMDYCSILAYTPMQFFSEFSDWLPLVLGSALIGVFCVFRLQKNRFCKSRSVESRVRKGLNSGKFYCLYQPIVDLCSGQVKGCEVLARFEDQFGVLSPMDFIPVVAKAGLSLEFTKYIVNRAMLDLSAFPESAKPFCVNINAFPADFVQDPLWDYLQSIEMNGLDMVVEITEDQRLDSKLSKNYIGRAQQIGIKIAIDDFGTGYSNLNHIGELGCDILKIDRSFIKGLQFDAIRSSLIPNIVDIAMKYQMCIVAEGIETEEQYEIVKKLGVQYGQGWLFGRPVPASELNFHADHFSAVEYSKVS